jgi:predicted nucleic acid-binding protein
LVCADTDFLVALERHDPDALRKVRELAVRGDTLYVTVISVAEFYRGAYGMRDREGAISSARSLLGLFAILNLDRPLSVIGISS